jgi:hypothetical protein
MDENPFNQRENIMETDKVWINLKRPINLEAITIAGDGKHLKAGKQEIHKGLLSHWLIQSLIACGDVIVLSGVFEEPLKEDPPPAQTETDWEAVVGKEEDLEKEEGEENKEVENVLPNENDSSPPEVPEVVSSEAPEKEEEKKKGSRKLKIRR